MTSNAIIGIANMMYEIVSPMACITEYVNLGTEATTLSIRTAIPSLSTPLAAAAATQTPIRVARPLANTPTAAALTNAATDRIPIAPANANIPGPKK